jgi:Ca2+ transporting ATPase
LRRVRDRLCPRKIVEEEEDPVLELARQRQADLVGKEDVEEEVKEFDPEQPVIEEPPLRGLARLNPIKQVQRRQRLKKMKKKKKSKGVESGSVLQKKLNKLALLIGYGGTLAAVLCVVVLVLKFSIERFGIQRKAWDSSTDFSELLHFVIIGITVLVVAVPEGLPLAVTIALAFSVKKMLKDNNLVRYLHACETMGNATAICSDKTGTLTTNRMTVVESYFTGMRYKELPKASDLPDDLMDALKMNIAVNSSYTSKLLQVRIG